MHYSNWNSDYMEASEISTLVMEECSEKILTGAYNLAKSAAQLSIECGIPMSLCCEKIELLEKLGLIRRIDTRLTTEGEEIGLFRSEMRKATIFHDDGSIKVKFEFKSGMTKEY